MKLSNNRLPGSIAANPLQNLAGILLLLLLLTACGSGSNDNSAADPPLVATCVPTDPSTASECGTVLLGMTDADGDFLSYTVDVVSMTLEKASGVIVEVMPASMRIDFASYVDLTERVSASKHREEFLPEVRDALTAFEERQLAGQPGIERAAEILLEANEVSLARRYLTEQTHTAAAEGLRLMEALAESIEMRTRMRYGIRVPDDEER